MLMAKTFVLQTVFAMEFLMGLPKPIWLNQNSRTTSGGGNRSGLSSPFDSSNPPAPSPQQPGTKTTSAPTSPLKVLSLNPVKCKSNGPVASFTNQSPFSQQPMHPTLDSHLAISSNKNIWSVFCFQSCFKWNLMLLLHLRWTISPLVLVLL